jgi:hypothetical protein
MLTNSSRTSRKFIASSLVLLVSFLMISTNGMAVRVRAGGQACLPGQTQITVNSGNGTICTPDSEVEFFDTDTATWVPALVVDPNVKFFAYDTIPGTQWNALNCDRSGQPGTTYQYRVAFTLPASFTSPSLSIQVHCDNHVTIFLNGHDAAHQIGSQPDIGDDPANFQNPPEVFTTNVAALFLAGQNVLSFDVQEISAGITALDFLADICYTPSGCNDQNPPSVTCDVTENSLWPPNHQLVNVGLTASVTDDCDQNVVIGGGPTGTGVAVYSDEQDLDVGSGNFSPDAKNIGLGTLRLRSERAGPINGRVYLIVVQATDASGKTGFCTETVTVPHDQSKASKDSVAAQAAAAQAYFAIHLMPPPGFVQVGVGPIVGPKQ